MSAETAEALKRLEGELAESVRRIAAAVERLDSSSITERVLVLLIREAAGMRGNARKQLTATAIRRVLEGCRRLPEYVLKAEDE